MSNDKPKIKTEEWIEDLVDTGLVDIKRTIEAAINQLLEDVKHETVFMINEDASVGIYNTCIEGTDENNLVKKESLEELIMDFFEGHVWGGFDKSTGVDIKAKPVYLALHKIVKDLDLYIESNGGWYDEKA
jgi:hypothetical protein